MGYYMGDYVYARHAGDPGLFKFLKRAAGFAVRTFVPGAGALSQAGALIGRQQKAAQFGPMAGIPMAMPVAPSPVQALAGQLGPSLANLRKRPKAPGSAARMRARRLVGRRRFQRLRAAGRV